MKRQYLVALPVAVIVIGLLVYVAYQMTPRVSFAVSVVSWKDAKKFAESQGIRNTEFLDGIYTITVGFKNAGNTVAYDVWVGLMEQGEVKYLDKVGTVPPGDSEYISFSNFDKPIAKYPVVVISGSDEVYHYFSVPWEYPEDFSDEWIENVTPLG